MQGGSGGDPGSALRGGTAWVGGWAGVLSQLRGCRGQGIRSSKVLRTAYKVTYPRPTPSILAVEKLEDLALRCSYGTFETLEPSYQGCDKLYGILYTWLRNVPMTSKDILILTRH